jgi:hypothetical protein
VVTERNRAHSLADGLNDPGALVSEDGRCIARRVDPGCGVHVGVTHAAGYEPDQHLTRAGVGQVELLNDERRSELLQHRGAHLHGCLLLLLLAIRISMTPW